MQIVRLVVAAALHDPMDGLGHDSWLKEDDPECAGSLNGNELIWGAESSKESFDRA